MFVQKNDACKIVTRECRKLARYVDKRNEYADELHDRYNMSIENAAKILDLSRKSEQLTDFEIYCIIDVVAPVELKKIFTPNEIKVFSKEKFNSDKVEFPLVFNAIEVDADQWLSVIKCSDLMKMRDAKLINYNQNTQRTLRRIVKGTEERYTIAVNYKQVHSIEDSFESGAYISNTITLNIPEDAEFDYIDGKPIIPNLYNQVLNYHSLYIVNSKIL